MTDADAPSGVSDDVRKAARGSVALGVGQAGARAAQLLFVLLVTRAVSPEQFGRYSIASALLVFGSFVSDFGTTRMIVRTVSRDIARADRLLSGTLLASVALGAVAWAGIVAFAVVAYAGVSTVDVVLAGAALPLMAAGTSFAGALDGAGRFAARSVANLLQACVVALGGAAAVMITDDMRWALACIPLGALAGLVVAARAAVTRGLLHSRLRVDLAECRGLLRASLPFALFAGLGALSGRFDVTLLSIIDGPADAAAYDVALRGTESLWYLHSLVTGPTLFLLSRRLGAGDRRGAQRAFTEAVRLSYLIGLLLSALLVGLHEPLIRLLGGAAYGDAATALALLGPGLFLTFVGLVQGTLILAGDHHRAGLFVAGAVTAATLALDLVMVPIWGIAGAAGAASITSLLTCVTFAWFGQRSEGLRTPLPAPA
ncbi:MAG: oligosaccharide flippase family protein, partial [Acidimicrobiales bacterium]